MAASRPLNQSRKILRFRVDLFNSRLIVTMTSHALGNPSLPPARVRKRSANRKCQHRSSFQEGSTTKLLAA